jgi:hypothetical protein
VVAAFRSIPVVADDLTLLVASTTPYVGQCPDDTCIRGEDGVTKGMW